MTSSDGKLICCACGAELDPKGEFEMTSDYRAACTACLSLVRETARHSKLERLRLEELQAVAKPDTDEPQPEEGPPSGSSRGAGPA